MQKSVEEKLQALIDKQEISELCARYMRALDRVDIEMLRSVYHDDATDHRGFFDGKASDFIHVAMEMINGCESTQHLLGQINIDLEGDMAFGEVYFQAYHRVIEDEKVEDFVIWGRYIDRYEKRSGVWKIAHRTMLVDFDRTDPVADVWSSSTPEALFGARGKDDLSCQRDVVRQL